MFRPVILTAKLAGCYSVRSMELTCSLNRQRFHCTGQTVSLPVRADAVAIALSRWMASQGTVRYRGEWHTHPEDYPHPSGLDRSEWNYLSAKRRDKRSMLSVIVGRKALYVELVPSSGRGSVLTPVE